MSQRFHNKTVIITGAAGGIGRGIARLFHQEGGNVVVSDIDEENVQKVAEQHYRESMDLLLLSVIMGMKHSIPHLAKTGGSIINISSTTGICADRGNFIYAAAKAAVNHLTKCAALQLADQNIRVSGIAPGMIMTPIYRSLIPELYEDNPEHLNK